LADCCKTAASQNDESCLMQAILHRLEEQKLQALFTSSQKRGSIQKLLQAVTSRLQQDKPKADMLMIMAVGD